jgi:hypothetical protein
MSSENIDILQKNKVILGRQHKVADSGIRFGKLPAKALFIWS